MTRTTILLALAIGAFSGCGDFCEPFYGGISLDGRVGDKEAPRDPFLEFENYNDGYGNEFVLVAHNGVDDAVMGGVYIEGVALDELEPNTMIIADNLSGFGDVTLYDDNGTQELDMWDVYVEGIGCSGESPDFYDVDVPAEKVVIKVSGRRGQREIEFENHFKDGQGKVTGVVAGR